MAYTSPSITASGTTWQQLQNAGPRGHLERLLAAQAATAAPTAAATATATGGGSTGGSLAAGTYYFVHTETNGIGETTASPEGSQLTVSAGNIPRFTFPALKTGNTARNLYLGAKNGDTGGPYYRYASGITASTYDASAAVTTKSHASTRPPSANRSGMTYTAANGDVINTALRLVRGAEKGHLQDAYRLAMEAVSNFAQGEPTSWDETMQAISQAHFTFALLSTLCAEIGTLVDANAGSIRPAMTSIGTSKTVRVWP